MPEDVRICPDCDTKNRIPTNRDASKARCGKCRKPLVVPSQGKAWNPVQGLIPLLVFGVIVTVYSASPQLRGWITRLQGTTVNLPTSSTPQIPVEPLYWNQLSRLEPLLSAESDVPFSERDFLWFIYESNDFGSYPTVDDRTVKVLIEHLKQREALDDFRELFELRIAAANVKSEIEAEMRRLQIELEANKNREAFANGFKSGFEGGRLGATAYNQGASSNDAILVAAAYTLVSTLVRSYEMDQNLEATKRQALTTLANRARSSLDVIAVRERALKQRILPTVQLANIEGAMAGVVRREVDTIQEMASRPASPESAGFGIQIAERLLRLRTRIPAQPMFDPWRAMAAFWGAYFLENVALEECRGKPWGENCSKTAALAVRVWDLVLKNDPVDQDFYVRAHRACCMALSGRPIEARDAVRPWMATKSEDPGFASLYVRLLCLSGDNGTESLEWLSRSIDQRRLQATDWFRGTSFPWNLTVTEVRKDASLATLILRKSDAVTEIVRPRFQWSWIEGWVSDEVRLTNRSNFYLTNVKMTVTFRGGPKPYSKVFESKIVAPSETVCWKDLKIPAKPSPSDSVHLQCSEQ